MPSQSKEISRVHEISGQTVAAEVLNWRARRLILFLWPPYEIGQALYFCPVVSIYLLLVSIFLFLA